MPSGASLTNCYRPRKGDNDEDGEEKFAVPQSFTFMAREGANGKGLFFFKLSKSVVCSASRFGFP